MDIFSGPNFIWPKSTKALLSYLSGVLGEQSHFKPRNNLDMRKTRARQLRSACHSTHVDVGFERKGKFLRKRHLVSKDFCKAMELPDREFNKLITSLTTIKKFNL